ncbi:MAG: hypothetical protein IJV99_03830 [Clostridia bacterium]|nr:hypothetical protein [Clostridia bacterium]
MNARFFPVKINGSTEASSYVETALRYFTLAAVANGRTKIYLKNETEDVYTLKDAFGDLGVGFYRDRNVYVVDPASDVAYQNYVRMDVKNSLVAFRFMLPVLLAKTDRCEIKGADRLSRKDVTKGLEILKGVRFDGKTLPLVACGRLKTGDYLLDGDANSQIASALMMALPLLDGDSTLNFIDKPKKKLSMLLEQTALAMKEFGVAVEKVGNGYKIKGGAEYTPPEKEIVIEGDYSTAGYFLALNLLGSNVEVKNLNPKSLQTDKIILDYLQAFKEGKTEIELKAKTGLVFLVVGLACAFDRTTTFTNFKLKEKDVELFGSFKETLERMGAKIQANGETLIVKGGSLTGGIMLDTFGDSRVAKTLVMLTTVFESPVTILSVEASMIEQNTFLNEFRRLGGNLQTV